MMPTPQRPMPTHAHQIQPSCHPLTSPAARPSCQDSRVDSVWIPQTVPLPGKGTVDNPFVLCSSAHLSLIGDTGTHADYTLSASYVMGQNINLNNVSFTPIAGAFTGTLDGRDKKIMNLTINVSGHAALFLELGSGGKH